MFQTLMRSTPIWLFGLLIMAGCVVASEFGRFLHRRRTPREDETKSSTEGYVAGAVFSLLAFMISVTFSIAVDRFDSKRALVEHEASAILTSYQRAALLDEPGRTRLQGVLRSYAMSRVALERTWNTPNDEALARTRLLQRTLWATALDACYPLRTTSLASSVIQAVNETLEMGSRRELARLEFVPARVILTLVLYLFVASSVLGYMVDANSGRRRALVYVLFALYTAAITLVVDLDSPLEGAVRVPQAALEQVAAAMSLNS